MKAQNLILILEDGREIVATVPEFIKHGEILNVMKIRISEPYELPEGCTWEELDCKESG